jgi:hypothetical protein
MKMLQVKMTGEVKKVTDREAFLSPVDRVAACEVMGVA